MEAAEGIHRIEIPLGERYVCSYLCVGERAAIVVDSGIASSPETHILPALRAITRAHPKLVITSHADMDHLGGNAGLRAAFPDCVLACHALDRELVDDREALIAKRYRQFEAEHRIVDPESVYDWMRENTASSPVDLELVGGELLRLGDAFELEVLHTPGHSRGHISLYAKERRLALVGDSVLGAFVPTADGRPSLPPTYRDVDEYLATIDELERREPQVLLTGHYAVLDSEASVRTFLDESRAFADRFELEILATLDGAPRGQSTRELIDHLSPRMGDWAADVADMLAFPLVGHLERLEKQGRLRRYHEDGPVRWELR